MRRRDYGGTVAGGSPRVLVLFLKFSKDAGQWSFNVVKYFMYASI